MKQLIAIFAFWGCCSALFAQITLTDSAKVSLITADPGRELYSIYGHSALHVRDLANGVDICYNYGTFDFDQPNFILKFCRGRLLYFLDLDKYRSFEYGYMRERRALKEQFFALDKTQKQRIFDLLQENAKEENRYYKYDFFYDNCATRIRDIVKETFFHQIYFDSAAMPPGITMRQLLHPYMKNYPWTGFGIDLVLGQPCDKKASVEDFMFLPEHMHDIFATTQVDGKPLVSYEKKLPENGFPAVAESKNDPIDLFFGNPLWVMCLVLVIGLLSMANPRTEHIFDTLFWFVLGTAGLIMALLWFATDHLATKNNWNLLWALPTHLLFFWRRNRTEWTENYFTGAAILAALALAFWKFLPQAMPVAAIPVAILVVVKGMWRRYWRKSDEIA